MRIARYKTEGGHRYGIVEEGRLYPCAGDPFTGLKKEKKSIDLGSVRLLAPVSPPNVICAGLNYKKHAEEAGLPFPPNPLIFLKATTSVCGPGDSILLPKRDPDEIDYEVELAIIIGKQVRDLPEDRVHEAILGYTVANDVSNRGVQLKESQWARGKSYDTFCPLGPMIVTDLDGDNLNLTCRLDGKVMQSSNTSDMIFPTRKLVSYLSECMTLLPGTVILTGTPPGVGFARKPPVFLREGQVVECEIEGIGILSNPVRREK